jgi:hypothetical protein
MLFQVHTTSAFKDFTIITCTVACSKQSLYHIGEKYTV